MPPRTSRTKASPRLTGRHWRISSMPCKPAWKLPSSDVGLRLARTLLMLSIEVRRLHLARQRSPEALRTDHRRAAERLRNRPPPTLPALARGFAFPSCESGSEEGDLWSGGARRSETGGSGRATAGGEGERDGHQDPPQGLRSQPHRLQQGTRHSVRCFAFPIKTISGGADIGLYFPHRPKYSGFPAIYFLPRRAFLPPPTYIRH